MTINKDLPYNLKVTGNEVILEMKESGATYNLNQLPKDEAASLGYALMNWGTPEVMANEPETGAIYVGVELKASDSPATTPLIVTPVDLEQDAQNEPNDEKSDFPVE